MDRIIIIGGGVMGMSIAWKLAEARAGRVTLLEKRFPGAGSSGKSGAICRAHYSHASTIGMARDSIAVYSRFQDRMGLDVGWSPSGVCIVGREADREALSKNVELMQEEGVQVALLEADELRELEPRGNFHDDSIGAFEPGAGFVNPQKVLAAFAAVARESAVQLQTGVVAQEIRMEGDRAVGVATNEGVFEADVVINCGGAWARKLMEPLIERLGLELPLQAIRPEQAFFEPPGDFGDPTAVYCDLETGIYWKPEQASWTRVGKMAYDGDEPVSDPDRYDEGVSQEFIDFCRPRLAERIPLFEHAVDWGGCGALYTVTPDAHPLIGRVPGTEGLYLCAGWSGHGFKMGPAVGAAMTALLTGGDPDPFDPALFDPSRFTSGTEVRGSHKFGILG